MRRAPLLLLLAACATPADYGVLVMAHGGSDEWDRRVLDAVGPAAERFPVEVAFGMADAASIQAAVERLDARGVRRVGVVRLFVSGESWNERTRQILGIDPGAPPRGPASPHAGHSMEFWRIESNSTFAVSEEGLSEAPEMGEILVERAAALSRDPAREDVLILAHGPGDDAENERWLRRIDRLADAVRASRPYRRVEAMTLREDWPEKRVEAEKRIRAFVEGGGAIVVPFRVAGFGPYAGVLDGLEYASDGTGLLPHRLVEAWIVRQAERLRAEMP